MNESRKGPKGRPGRVFHITWYKCGSQWIRGVLADPDILAAVGFRHISATQELYRQGLSDEQSRVIYAPVYEMNAMEWSALKKPEDKAIVVLRDPRDCLVSWLYSALYSHSSRPGIDLRRDLLYRLDGLDNRLKLLLGEVYYQQRFFATWREYSGSDALVLDYEDIVTDQQGHFIRMLEWLGWNVATETVDTVIDRHSFERRSGRRRGEADPVSHYRRGVPGDWRNYFTRQFGELWESLYPGMLSSAGYESDNEWWTALPEVLSDSENGMLSPGEERLEAQQRRVRLLEKELREKEEVVQELKAACDARLAVIHTLEERLSATSTTEEE